jgi:Uma2 family endonuclease
MAPPLPQMTMAEFLAWEAQHSERHEFYRGEIFAMVGGSARHNRVILNLASRIGDHLHGTPCQVFAESVKVGLADGYLYPDVMVTCGKALAGDEQVVHDPKLVIEVLSPNAKSYDRRDKFILYRSLASLQEYVLIDPVGRRFEVFTSAGTDTWTLVDQSLAEELTLSSINLAVPAEAVFKGLDFDEPVSTKCRIGILKGQINIPKDVDAPLPDQVLDTFEGEV